MRFDVVGSDRSDDTSIPEILSASVGRLPLDQVRATRTFKFGRGPKGIWTINKVPYQPGRPLARPRLGEVEIWRFITDVHHPIHVHLNHFQVLSRNNREPGSYDSGWKDTVDVLPPKPLRSRSASPTTPARSWCTATTCHNLEHEDMAMMADFVTI